MIGMQKPTGTSWKINFVNPSLFQKNEIKFLGKLDVTVLTLLEETNK